MKMESPNNTKELKSFLGAIQKLGKILPKLSEKNRQTQKIAEQIGTMEMGKVSNDLAWICK